MRRVINNWKSPLGVILAITHAITLSWLILSKEPTPLPIPPSQNEVPCSQNSDCFDFSSIQIAGRSVVADRELHFSYEHPILKFIIIIDFPALIIGSIVSLPLYLLHLNDFSALQCIWPTKAGKFPWDIGYPEDMIDWQPLLNRSNK